MKLYKGPRCFLKRILLLILVRVLVKMGQGRCSELGRDPSKCGPPDGASFGPACIIQLLRFFKDGMPNKSQVKKWSKLDSVLLHNDLYVEFPKEKERHFNSCCKAVVN